MPEVVSQKIRAAEWLALLGAALLLFSTFWPWFQIPGIDQIKLAAPGASVSGSGAAGALDLNVWDLGFLRWFVYLAIFLAVCMFLAALLSRTADWSVILATPLVVVSLVAMIGMLVRVFDAPRAQADPTTWFFLGVFGSILLFAGTCWAIRDDSVPPGFDQPPTPQQVEVE